MSFFTILYLALLSFPYCILLYGINDVYDYESDKINPQKKIIQGIVLEPKYHSFVKKSSYIIMILLFLYSLLFLNISNILGMFLLLFFSYTYSAPPLRFKTKVPLDSILNGIIYFFAPFLIGFSFGGTVFQIPLKIYLITLCVAGIHSFSTIMDYSIDKKSRDKTFAVVYGKRIASLFSFFMFALALCFSGIQTILINYYLIFCSLLFLIIFFFHQKK